MKSEIWVPAFEWEEFYEVSSLGRVRLLPRGAGRWKYPMILKCSPSGIGYPSVALNAKGRKSYYVSVNRLILSSFTRRSPRELEAAHINGDRTDNRIENLYWATKSQNRYDRVKHGRAPIGETHHTAKLNPDKIRAIRLALFRDKESVAKIARRFGVAHITITSIRDGRTWKHVPTSYKQESK